MLNAEKYKKEILENSNAVFDFSMSKDKHTIKKCLGVCDDCFFHEAGDHCSNIKVKWLLSEYKEPIKLSRLEYEFLKWIENEGYKYIVRDRENNLFIFKDAPTKHRNYWVSKSGYNPISLINNLFKFVQLSDEQPTSIKEVLENCEVVDDAKEL